MKTFIVLVAFIKFSFSAEILCIFPRPSFSHQSVYRAVTELLLEKKHKITLLTTHPSESEKHHENVTLIDVSFSAQTMEKLIDEVYESKSFWKTIL